MSAKRVIPWFSGNADDMYDFVTMILQDMTLEQLAFYAIAPTSGQGVTTASGYELPPSASGGIDAPAGCDTNLPMPIHIGQTWDIELAERVGEVIGNERRGQLSLADPNTQVYSASADMRINPLNGRYYEGYGEDPTLVSELVNATAKGINGTDPFYIKTQVNTKHFNVYACEWDRKLTSDYVSSRMFYEYHMRPYYKPFENKYLSGCMTAFGAINGIPSVFSPYHHLLRDIYPYSIYSIADFTGDTDLLNGLGNGYDNSYAVNMEEVAALLMRARAYSNSSAMPPAVFISAVNKGLLGIARNDLEELIRPQIEAWVRQGYFNQDAYPYVSITADGTPKTSADPEHRAVALQAAQDGIVLLKNDGNLLPLDKSSRIMVTGPLADYCLPTGFSLVTPEGIENTDLTPLEALRTVAGESASIAHIPELSGDIVVFKSPVTDKYIIVHTNGEVFANADDVSQAARFQVLDWVQDAYSLYDIQNDQYLATDAEPYHFDETGAVVGTEHPNIIMTTNDRYNMPPILTYEDLGAQGKAMRYRALIDSVLQQLYTNIPFYESYIRDGWYLSADQETGKVELGNSTIEGLTDSSRFEADIISEAGEGVYAYTADNDYAIVFVGASDYIGACEFSDRANLELGASQLKLISTVAEAFPGKTVVVVNYNFPLNLEAIEKNPNVGAIVYSTYGGQYEKYALAQVLFGDAYPSGHLTAAWLNGTTTMPQRQETQGIDPRYTVNMKRADPLQEKMTYMYHDEGESVVYPFGHGLSYTTFSYSSVSWSNTDYSLEVTVTVTNTGGFPGREVVQLYAACPDSKYAPFVAGKQLAGFAKTALLNPGESQILTLQAQLDNLKKWDVNRKQYILEEASYEFWFGAASNEKYVAEMGESMLSILVPQAAVNLWEYTYGAFNMIAAEVSKMITTAFIGEYVAVESAGTDSYVVMYQVDMNGVTGLELSAAAAQDDSIVEIYANDMSSRPICTFTLDAAIPVSYYLDENGEIPVTELAYTQIRQQVAEQTDQTCNLFFLFKQPGIRIDNVRFINAADDKQIMKRFI